MMLREELEKQEKERLSPFASLAGETRGRAAAEEECDIRTAYMRDRDRIVHCKAFRRLKDKTQMFLSPQGDHYRTRMTHTMEVSQIARTAARCLRLNEDLVEAIALGHDLGHTPFGHAGERALNAVHPGGFRHSEQSLRIVDCLEKDGEGLNLTAEVQDGILNHSLSSAPSTLEGQLVRICDKIAYIHHDMDDAVRAGILTERDVPADLRALLGETTRERLNTFVHDLVEHSKNRERITLSDEVGEGLLNIRRFMFECVYTNPIAKGEEGKAQEMLTLLYEHYNRYPERMTREFVRLIEEKGEVRERAVCDYISGMTDQYAIAMFEEIYIPRPWSKY